MVTNLLYWQKVLSLVVASMFRPCKTPAGAFKNPSVELSVNQRQIIYMYC